MSMQKKLKTTQINIKKLIPFYEQRYGKIESELIDKFDFDYSAEERRIETFSQFCNELYTPYLQGAKCVYRGERINSLERPLVPTILRSHKELFSGVSDGIVNIDSDYLFSFYEKRGKFIDVYENTMGKANRDEMYELCAFAQHYIDVSPFIDFTKSLLVAASFAIKGKCEPENDIVIYRVGLRDPSDCTQSMKKANEWVNEFNISVFKFEKEGIRKVMKELLSSEQAKPFSPEEFAKLEKASKNDSPRARLIDVPTNDRMKFQQGCFLMLSDFSMFFSHYRTKNVRNDFEVTKFVINRSACGEILDLINKETPWYSYDCLINIEKAFQKAIWGC